MELKEITLDVKDFMNLSSVSTKDDISSYKMLGKFSKEYMLKYIDEINNDINNNINHLDDYLNNITDEFELLCILFGLINHLDFDDLIKCKEMMKKYRSENVLLRYCDGYSIAFQCKTKDRAAQVIKLFKKLGAIDKLPKESWSNYKNNTCYYVYYTDNNISCCHLDSLESGDFKIYIKSDNFQQFSDDINQLEEKLKTSITV